MIDNEGAYLNIVILGMCTYAELGNPFVCHSRHYISRLESARATVFRIGVVGVECYCLIFLKSYSKATVIKVLLG